jgi:hypothetical protein
MDFRTTSEVIARVRLRCLALEQEIDPRQPIVATHRWEYLELRVNRWAILHLLAARNQFGLPPHPTQGMWPSGWEREFTGLSSVWSHLAVTASDNTVIEDLWPATTPQAFAPDGASIEDAGSDRVFWLVKGAAFEDANRTVQAPAAHFVMPTGLHRFLPKVPVAACVMAETQAPGAVFLVARGKKYASPRASWLAASGLTGATTAIVPTGGLTQIPDGVTPYWLSGLYISDNFGNPLDLWDPTPQVEGSSSTTRIGLTNKSSVDVVVKDVSVTTSQDGNGGAVFSVLTTRPLTVPAGHFLWVDVRFQPLGPGAIDGTVAVACDLPDFSDFAIPLATTAVPLGAHGTLELSTNGFDLGPVQVGHTVGQHLTLTNSGTRELAINVEPVDPAGQFGLVSSQTGPLAPGQSASVYVSCTPTVRGRVSATLSIDASGPTDTPRQYQQHAHVDLSATAQAAVVFLARAALPLRRAPGGPGLPPRPGGMGDPPTRLDWSGELMSLDFGAVAPGTTSTRTFWIRNVGDVPLNVTGLTPGSNLFWFPDLPGAQGVIQPGGELAVQANFLAPAMPGLRTQSELRVDTDDPLRPRAVLPVVGTSAGARLTTQPPERLTLDTTSPPTGELVLTSAGTTAITLDVAKLDDHDFTLGLPPLPVTLAPGTSLTVEVTYNGMQPGQHDAPLTLVLHDGPDRQQVVVGLRAYI